MKLHEVRDDITVIDRPPQLGKREDIKTDKPPMFHVVLNNDDYVAGEAVMAALQEVFGMNEQTAVNTMLRAHTAGKAMVGTFTRDVAETKAADASKSVEQFHGEMGVEGGVSQYLFTVEPAE